MSALVVTTEVNEFLYASSQILWPKLMDGNTPQYVEGTCQLHFPSEYNS